LLVSVDKLLGVVAEGKIGQKFVKCTFVLYPHAFSPLNLVIGSRERNGRLAAEGDGA
jgi:hypothetical protein